MQLHYLVQPTGSYEKLKRRLQKLYHHAYVDRPSPREQMKLWPSRGGRKHFVYGLGDEGAHHLSPKLSEASEAISLGASYWRKANREVGERYLAHTLMTNDFLVSLARATYGTSVDVSWQTEGEWPPGGERLYAPVRGSRGGTIRVPIRPDAHFTLTYKKQRRYFFLEADLASEPGWRRNLLSTSLFKKYLGYWSWYKTKQHRRFGMPGFIVLTTTTSMERARNLWSIAHQVDTKQRGSHMFWFTAETEYPDCRKLLEPIWLSAGDPPENAGRYHQLIEPSHTTR